MFDSRIRFIINLKIPFYFCKMIKMTLVQVHAQWNNILQFKKIIIINIFITWCTYKKRNIILLKLHHFKIHWKPWWKRLLFKLPYFHIKINILSFVFQLECCYNIVVVRSFMIVMCFYPNYHKWLNQSRNQFSVNVVLVFSCLE